MAFVVLFVCLLWGYPQTPSVPVVTDLCSTLTLPDYWPPRIFIPNIDPCSYTFKENDAAPISINANGTYHLAGVAPVVINLTLTGNAKFANIDHLKSITILEHVAIKWTDFMNFLKQHSQTLETVIIHKAKITFDYKIEQFPPAPIYMPNLKSYYISLEYEASGTYPSYELLPWIFPFTTKQHDMNSTRTWSSATDIWSKHVDITLIYNDVICFEMSHSEKILKSIRGEVLAGVDTDLHVLALQSTALPRTFQLPNPTSLHILILDGIDWHQRDNDWMVDWIGNFTSLRVLAFKPYDFSGSLKTDRFPSTLINMTIKTTFLWAGVEPERPPVMDNFIVHSGKPPLWYNVWPDGGVASDLETVLDKYYNSRNIAIRQQYPSVQVLKSMLRMRSARWIYYAYARHRYRPKDDVEPELKEMLQEELEMKDVGNSTAFIFERDSEVGRWRGRALQDQAEIEELEDNMYNLGSQYSQVTTAWTRKVSTLITTTKHSSYNGSWCCSIPKEELIFRGKDAIYQTIDTTITNVTNLILSPYTKTRNTELHDLIQANNSTLKHITLKGVTHSTIFKGCLHLPLLESLVIVDETVDRRKASFFPSTTNSFLTSVLPFLKKSGCTNTNFPRNYYHSWPLETLANLWEDGVDVIFRPIHKTLIHFNHTRGLFKSAVSEINMHFLDGNLTLPGKTLALSGAYFNRVPSFSASNVTKLVLDHTYINDFDAFIARFTNLSELSVKMRRSNNYFKLGTFSTLPNMVQKLSLDQPEFNYKTIQNLSAPNPMELDELNIIGSTWSLGDRLHWLFNARNITLTTNWEYPTGLVASATNMTQAEWIFVGVKHLQPHFQERTGLVEWRNLLASFGIDASEATIGEDLVLERGERHKWTGRWVGGEVSEIIRKERLDVGHLFDEL